MGIACAAASVLLKSPPLRNHQISPSGCLVSTPGSLSCCLNDQPQLPESLGRLGTYCIVGIHAGGAESPLIDYVSCRDRQAVIGLIVKSVQSVAKGLVKVAQIIWQCENQPKLLCNLQVKIGQNIERQIQLFMQGACIPFELRSDHDD